MSDRKLKPNEQIAWTRVARTVRPRPGQVPVQMPALEDVAPPGGNTQKATGIKAPPSMKVSLSAIAPHLAQTSDPAPKAHPVQDRKKERKVRRGQARIDATLDLHGLTQEQAQTRLVGFISSQRRLGASCVLVITGKGKSGEGVLRRRLLQWLGTGDARALINGYAEAHRKHGGSGAWYLFLRKPFKA